MSRIERSTSSITGFISPPVVCYERNSNWTKSRAVLRYQSSRVLICISEDSSSYSQSTSNGPVKGKKSSPLKSDIKSVTKDKKEAQNLIDKINNLVTTGLGNIAIFLMTETSSWSVRQLFYSWSQKVMGHVILRVANVVPRYFL